MKPTPAMNRRADRRGSLTGTDGSAERPGGGAGIALQVLLGLGLAILCVQAVPWRRFFRSRS